jgi:glycosyltransferase involved in cell wall biosynthesis
MQIAVFIKRTTLHPTFGGLETQNKLLCEGLVSRGHTVTIFSPKLGANLNTADENGVKYIFIDCSFRSLAGFGALDKNNWHNRSIDEFNKIHSTSPFDLVLGQSSAALGIIAKKEELAIPVVSISHGTILGEYKTRLQSLDTFKDLIRMIPDTGYLLLNFFKRQRQFVLHSNKIIAVSNIVKRKLIDETFVPASKITVVYNGIDSSKVSYDETVSDSGRVNFIYVGLIHPSKGLRDLVKAICKVDNAYLTIVGKGPYEKDLGKLISKLGVSDRISLAGPIPYETLLRTYKDYDVFVLPTRRMEGFPMTTVEAMFAGLPSLVSDMGGTPEAIENEVSGFVFESGNIRQLQDRITYFVNNPASIVSMGNAARKRAMSMYTLEKMVDEYEKVMQEVIK